MSFCAVGSREYLFVTAPISNKDHLLRQMGLTPEEVLAQLNAVGQPFGIRFGG